MDMFYNMAYNQNHLRKRLRPAKSSIRYLKETLFPKFLILLVKYICEIIVWQILETRPYEIIYNTYSLIYRLAGRSWEFEITRVYCMMNIWNIHIFERDYNIFFSQQILIKLDRTHIF